MVSKAKTAPGSLASLLIILCIALPGASLVFTPGFICRSSTAIKAVSDEGYTNVLVNSKHVFFTGWHGCSKHDDAAFDVSAKNVRGEQVRLTVCSTWFRTYINH